MLHSAAVAHPGPACAAAGCSFVLVSVSIEAHVREHPICDRHLPKLRQFLGLLAHMPAVHRGVSPNFRHSTAVHHSLAALQVYGALLQLMWFL